MKAKTWLRKAHPESLRGKPFKIENWEGGYVGSLTGLGCLEKSPVIDITGESVRMRYKLTLFGAARWLRLPQSSWHLF